MDVLDLLNHGTGTAIAVLLVFFIARAMNQMVHNQTTMIQDMAKTLKEVSTTLKLIEDNIKDLQTGQNALWNEVRNLKRGDKR